MKQLVIKIGARLEDDLRDIYHAPGRRTPNTHTLYLKKPEELSEILSPKRIELLKYIISNRKKNRTISEISKKLNRKQEAISRDANLLVKHNLIRKIRQKQMTCLKAIYGSLQIRLTA
ncbi:MAG: hypothetical protein J4224_01560 [Candidatus Diapherotrites archaeon]|uniref:Uncharacterized protein n=1 Tax=Candidatus Iainarchaeum sp. TaxID=3101447 RepID=A0A8T4KZN1_9ARCH|nr:hypothetical protein [Candidatus Diapherotrites archaeon]